jgi:hypothetical protein
MMEYEFDLPASVQFICPDCESPVDEWIDDLPAYDTTADSASDAQGVSRCFVMCPHCNANHEIQIVAIYPDVYEATIGRLEVALTVPHNIERTPDDDYELYLATLASADAWWIFSEAYAEIQQLVVPDNQLGRRLIFAQYIAIMEAYLNHRLLSLIEHEQFLVNLTRKIPLLSKMSVPLPDAFSSDAAMKLVREHLQQLMYHNVNKIDHYYRACLGETLFEDGKHQTRLNKLVKLRHDFVHRNGRDREKVPIPISPFIIETARLAILKVVSKVERAYCKMMDLPDPILRGVDFNNLCDPEDLDFGDYVVFRHELLKRVEDDV